MSIQQLPTWNYLAPKPGSHYRQLFIKGTRIAARVLYGYYSPGADWAGRSAEEIAADFNLPIEAVREAIVYCETDPPEIREDLRREEELIAATCRNRPNEKCQSSHKLLSAEDYARIFLR